MFTIRIAYTIFASISVVLAGIDTPPTLTSPGRGLLSDEPLTRLKRQSNAPCRPGQYYTTKCKACTAGYSCPDGQNRNPCGAGAYSGPSATQCTLCPKGTFSNKQTTKYVTGCETVAPGHRANNSIGATAQIACGKGSYSMGATDTCTTCPAGSKCTSSRTEAPTECEPGTYSNAGNSGSCTNCPKGTFSSINGATSCCSCCSGSYSDTTGASSCSGCASGQGSPPGSKAASKCSASNTNGVRSCNQSADGTCPATANTIAASGRSRRARRDVECEFPYERCAIPGLGDSYECVNVQSDVESCGGCTGAGGMDCTSISNILAADCRAGSCVVRSCAQGFDVSTDRKSCVRNSYRRFIDE